MLQCIIFLAVLLCWPFSVSAMQSPNSQEILNKPPNAQATPDNSSSLMNLSHELSENELHWYTKFHNGLMLFDGWKQISADILRSLPDDKKDHTRSMLKTLGIKIGREWCKDNSIRRIDTDQLRSWGRRLRKAEKEGADRLLNIIKNISGEVDTLLTEVRPPLSN